MSDWRPLSERRGLSAPEGPFEGVPPHLRYPLRQWLERQFGWHRQGGLDMDLMGLLASGLRIQIVNSGPERVSNQILAAIEGDENRYLDCLDMTLNFRGGFDSGTLANILRVGGSAWTVSADQRTLERRVDAALEEAFGEAVQAGDAAAVELQNAWSAIFGRSPNPSDAWDHAIKAVEDVLIPIVIPRAEKGNLGGVAGELKAHPEEWSFGIPGNASRNNGETLEGLLRHIWPNSDRHGGSTKRAPTAAEAEGVVRIAVLIVGLCRGRLTRGV